MFIKEDFKMDFNKIKEAAQNYEADMTKFLREIVKFPGESCGEKDHIERIAEEMRKLDFDKVEIDPQGNVLGYMGTGETLIGFDAHIDTVGIGNRDNWEFDPYEGFESDTEIGGRGTSDQLGGIVSAVYGARIMKDLGLLSDKYMSRGFAAVFMKLSVGFHDHGSISLHDPCRNFFIAVPRSILHDDTMFSSGSHIGSHAHAFIVVAFFDRSSGAFFSDVV